MLGLLFGLFLASVLVYTAWVEIKAKDCARRFVVTGKHVFLTGASQGLGFSLAKQLIAKGAKVTVLARGEKALQDAESKLKAAAARGGTVLALTADVTKSEEIETALKRAIEAHGPIFMLLPCAGYARTGYFGDVPERDFRQCMDTNYFGVLNTVRCAVPHLKEQKGGHIVIVSSGLALTAYMGYSAYTPTKWALRGLALTLRNELLPYRIKVYSAYPPNMKTPGYDIEEKTKPAETKQIESSDPVYDPEIIARSILTSVARGSFDIPCGDFGIGMLTIAGAGMGPRDNILLDALLLPILVFIAKVVAMGWDRIALKGTGIGGTVGTGTSGATKKDE